MLHVARRIDQPVASRMPDKIAVPTERLSRVETAVKDLPCDPRRKIVQRFDGPALVLRPYGTGRAAMSARNAARISGASRGWSCTKEKLPVSLNVQAICRHVSQSIHVVSTKIGPGTFSATAWARSATLI
jgi:hypothetical protein